ncbi:MAG: FecR domain-containing protein [Bacteroidota bacterium]
MEKFITYDAIMLAEEQSFIRWTLNKDAQAVAFWEEWIEKHPERANVVKEAKDLVLAIKFKEQVLPASEADLMWASIAKQVEERPVTVDEANKSLKVSWRPIMAVAASILLLITAYFIVFDNDYKTIEADKAEWLVHNLPDGSVIDLNAVSKINYKKEDWLDNRVIDLEGEAFFDVQEGNDFQVNTVLGQVTVLGTRFNVYSREGVFRVECFSGKVQVIGNSQDTVILTANQQVSFKDNETDATTLLIPENRTWKAGFFEYDNVTFEEVFEEMERQFDIDIEADKAILNLTYNGYFENSDLEAAFQSVCFTQGLTPKEIGNKRYTITK